MIFEKEAREKLERYQKLFEQAVRNAFADWEAYGVARIIHQPRTQTSLIHDHLVDQLKRLFADVPGVQFPIIRGRTLMLIKDDFVTSIKKLDKRHRSSSVATAQSVGFLHQASLPGLEPATNLIFGYTYNETRTGWDEIWVTCPDGFGLAYEWCIARADAVPENISELRPADVAVEGERKRRVRRRDKAAQEGTDATDSSG